jgi:hypothetical protein
MLDTKVGRRDIRRKFAIMAVIASRKELLIKSCVVKAWHRPAVQSQSPRRKAPCKEFRSAVSWISWGLFTNMSRMPR